MTCTATPPDTRLAAADLLKASLDIIIANPRRADPLDALYRAVTANDAGATAQHLFALRRLYAAIPVDARANTLTGYANTAGRDDIIALLNRAIAACDDPNAPLETE